MKKVFFVTYGGGHVQIAIPVIKELVKNKIDVKVLALTTSVFPLKENKISYKGIKDYLSILKDKEKIISIGKNYINQHYNAESALEKEEILAYLGINIYDLKLQTGSLETAQYIFEEQGRKAFYPYYSMKKIIEYEKPDVIFLTCGKRMEKAAGKIGDELGIQVVRVIDLLGRDDVIPYHAKVMVMNEMVKENILKNNEHLKTDDVFVTGQPNLEIIVDDEDLNKFKKKYNVDNYYKVVSMFSQPEIKQREQVYKALIEYAQGNPKNLVFYKLHPSEDLSEYISDKDLLPSNFKIGKDMNLNSVLECSDITLTFFSTVGLQAISIGKPLVTINLTSQKYGLDYSALNYSIEVNNLRNLENTITQLLNDESELSNKLKTGKKDLVIPKNSAINISKVILND